MPEQSALADRGAKSRPLEGKYLTFSFNIMDQTG